MTTKETIEKEKPQCFVMHPFSDDFMKISDEIYISAIEEVGLKPFRLDQSKNIKKLKIEDLMDQIRNSRICLADITKDKANVWYEVGFADGEGIPVLLVCEKPALDNLPFDLNQRNVLPYDLDNLDKLRGNIVSWLKHNIDNENLQSKKEETDKEGGENNFDINELGNKEWYILWALYYGVKRDHKFSKEAMMRYSAPEYSQDDMTDAFNWLVHWGLIEIYVPPISVIDGSNDPRDSGSRYKLIEKGKSFCMANTEKLRQVER